jgi:hypothetical protein
VEAKKPSVNITEDIDREYIFSESQPGDTSHLDKRTSFYTNEVRRARIQWPFQHQHPGDVFTT